MTVPLFGVPLSHVPVEAVPLSDLDKETERYIERILMGVMSRRAFCADIPRRRGGREAFKARTW
jgi:hypothetical protein